MKPRPSPPTVRRKTTRSRRKPKAPARLPVIRFCIFDLDDTLYDCFGQRVRRAHRHAARALAQAGVPATTEQILGVRMRAFRRDPRLDYIDREVCRRFGVRFSEELHQIARQAYFGTPVQRLRLFPGARRMLRTLRRKGVRNFIVSYGEPSIQRAKVRALGLEKEPAIERVFYADTGKIVTKDDLFRSLLRKMKADASFFLVVGDRPSSEIRAGKRLGMHTARLRHGEFARLEPESIAERAEFGIRRVTAVLHLPLQFGRAAAGRAS